MKLFDMRTDYTAGTLGKEDLTADPLDLFTSWFKEACEKGVIEPNAVSLATCSKDAFPLVRTVLVKQFDKSGFSFFTNYESRKARHISENPRASLLFPWLALQRQVIVTGTVARLTLAESLSYFASRPVDAQLAAWASRQSRMISSRDIIRMAWEQTKQKFADGKIPLPPFWGGFRVTAESIEFWQGRSGRLHDRFLYTRQPEDRWNVARLAP